MEYNAHNYATDFKYMVNFEFVAASEKDFFDMKSSYKIHQTKTDMPSVLK